MLSRFRITSMLLSGSVVLGLLGPVPAVAAGSTLTVTQQSPIETIGAWTIIYPSNEKLERSDIKGTVENLPAGRYTMIIRAPEGMTTKVELIRGNEMLQTLDHPQLSFDVADGDAFQVNVTYTIIKGGNVGISSDPVGMPYELSGPDNLKRTGVTPDSFTNMPQGNYSVKYSPKGCPPPPAQSARMGEAGRADFSIRIVCSTFEPSTKQRRESEIVNTGVDGEGQSFIDVPKDAWFAPYVVTVARRGIITGYKDGDGNSTHLFGPGNAVTIAELSKIAHEMGKTNEKAAAGDLLHAAAAGTWFEVYFRSATEQGWLVYQDPELDPSRPATRAEVIATFLQVIDVPMQWPKGKSFDDVKRTTLYAGAIETALSVGIVEGSEEGDQRLFHPADPINRAEISKILIAIQEKYQQKYDRDDEYDL